MGNVLSDFDWKIVGRIEELTNIIAIHDEELETLNKITCFQQEQIRSLYELLIALEKEVIFLKNKKTPV